MVYTSCWVGVNHFNLEIHVSSEKICWIDFWKFLPLNFSIWFLWNFFYLDLDLLGRSFNFLVFSLLFSFSLVLLLLVFSYLHGESLKFILWTFFWIFHFCYISISKGSSAASKYSFLMFCFIIKNNLSNTFEDSNDSIKKNLWVPIFLRTYYSGFVSCYGGSFISIPATLPCLLTDEKIALKLLEAQGVGVVGHRPQVTHYMVTQKNYFIRHLQLSAYWLGVSYSEAGRSKSDSLKLVDTRNITLQMEAFPPSLCFQWAPMPWSPNPLQSAEEARSQPGAWGCGGSLGPITDPSVSNASLHLSF